MPISRARSIDELYDAVAGSDLVLTNDAPLSLALNRRIDEPRLGRFAATPRMLASGAFRPEDRRELFLELISRTDLTWKHAAYLLEHILGCWEETGRVDAILEHAPFDTPATREALAVVADAPSAHRELAAFTVDEGRSVAVIGEDHFTALDRSVLPPAYDSIELVTDGTFSPPPFRIFDSATAIVDTLVESITPATAERVGVVMDPASRYPALVEAALEAAGIPFHGGPAFADDAGIRTVLGLLRLAFSRRAIRLADLQPILTHLGEPVPVRDAKRRVDALDDPAIRPITELLDAVDDRTFDEVLAVVEGWGGGSLTPLREELERLGYAALTVTEPRLDDLEFYLQTFDVPHDREDAGVLLADPGGNFVVDRPVVFHLGMDQGWTPRIPDRPWIDAAEKDRLHLERFQVLLQNGRERYYLVQDTHRGRSVSPCLYFHDLLDDAFEGFSDLPHTEHGAAPAGEAAGFAREAMDVPAREVSMLSQSSLNTLVNCPRDLLFARLVASPDRDYFAKGTLFHDFAAFYVSHPGFVDGLDRAELVEPMVAELRPFVDDIELGLLRTELAVGIETIVDFLAGSPPVERAYDTYGRSDAPNFFAEAFGRPVDSPVTEVRFENPGLGGRGTVDLIHAPTRLLDYKSGSRSTAATVVRRSSLEPIHDEPDFQALLYLAHHRQVRPGERLEFVFFHFLETLDDAVTGEPDLDDALVTVVYHPMPFAEYARTEAAFDALRAGVAEGNPRRRTLEALGYERYARFLDGHDLPDVVGTDEPEATAFARAFVEYATDHVGEYVYVERGVESAVRTLAGLRSDRYFEDDVDAFEAFLAERVDDLNAYRRGRFPVGDPNPDRLTHRDLIRDDD